MKSIRLRGLAHALVIAICLVEPAAAVDKITVLGLFKNKAVVKIDGKQRLLKLDEPSPEGVKLISATSEEAVLEVDGETSTYKLGSHIGTQYAKPKEGPAVQVWPDEIGMYRIIGSINGYPVNFMIDTGATVIAMNKNEAKRLGIDYLVEGTPGAASTASGVVATYQVVLRKVKIGEVGLNDVHASVLDGDFPTDVLLGNSFLNRLDMQRKGKMMELRKKY